MKQNIAKSLTILAGVATVASFILYRLSLKDTTCFAPSYEECIAEYGYEAAICGLDVVARSCTESDSGFLISGLLFSGLLLLGLVILAVRRLKK